MPTESVVRDALRAVKYPDASKDVVASGMVKAVSIAGTAVTIEVSLPTMAVSEGARAAFEQGLLAAARSVPGVTDAHVDSVVRVASLPKPADKNRLGLAGVKNVIAVASGKGGVGKSTVAVNLALALKQWGARVGLIDADVFGPSVPQMLGMPATAVRGTEAGRIAPAVYYDMKVMSVAFFVEKGEAVVWRGPMVHKLLQQFVEDVEWGELDYLVIDLPPGTGDVQLSLSQLVPLAGAVMVTTPQEVAVIDVIKGISMFRKVDVPILGIIENMSYYVCPSCGHHDEIFARGGGRRLAETTETPFLGEIPIDTKVRFGGDTGHPVVVAAPESAHARIFVDIAAKVAGRIAAAVLSGPRRAAGLVALG